MNSATVKPNTDTDFLSRLRSLNPFIGNTPLFPIRNIETPEQVGIFAKLEWQQLGGSVKARAAHRILKDAAARSDLDQRHLLDASSGNTGIAYASIGAATGIPVTLFLPENASRARKDNLRALGVTLRQTSRTGTTDEAQKMALELSRREPDTYYYADQYSNDSNWTAHYETTGPEIFEQTDGKITHFITGLGTTGTFTGIGRYLREQNPEIKLISLQPDIPMHGLEGWKHMDTAKVPEIYDPGLADENRFISTDQAYDVLKLAAANEGLILSPSAAANLAGALKLAREIDSGIIVTVFPDDGSKYQETIQQLLE